MVLSRIILTAFLALGSATVALPVVPGHITSTMLTPGSGAPPRLQGSLAVGDTAVPPEDGMKGISPLVGGLSSPHGNAAGSNISRRQPSSAAGSSSDVPPPVSNGAQQSQAELELMQHVHVVKNYNKSPESYRKIAERLRMNLHKENPTKQDEQAIIDDSTSVVNP